MAVRDTRGFIDPSAMLRTVHFDRFPAPPALAGLVLIAIFVIYSFRPKHPLIDLRLFKNYDLSVSAITMFLFAGAFFGGLLIVPTYFQQVRGESALDAGVLMAVQKTCESW